MSGKNEKEAAENFVNFFQQTISCITQQGLTAYQQSKKLYKVWLQPPAELKTKSGAKLVITITQVFAVTADPTDSTQFKVRTREYSYVLYRLEKGVQEEILAYHWHPHDSDLHSPHLHVRCVPRVHFPTSRICLEDFVWMILSYYHAKSPMKRSEWNPILDKNKKAFERFASWKINPPEG